MNPEPSAAESSQVPPEPAGGTDLAGTTARDGAAVGTTVALPGSAAGALPAASTADAPVLSPTADVADAPGLAPAANMANAPGLAPAACGARLAELFPALFSAAGAPGPVRPIKLRIHADIQARAPGIFSKRALGIFFSRYTTTNAYLKALTLAPHRFDLDGQAAGEISDEHRQLATEELARRHALAAERRAAQRPAPRRDATTRDDGAAPGAQREPPPAHRPDPRPDARPAAPPRRASTRQCAANRKAQRRDAAVTPGAERTAAATWRTCAAGCTPAASRAGATGAGVAGARGPAGRSGAARTRVAAAQFRGQPPQQGQFLRPQGHLRSHARRGVEPG